MTTHGGTNDQGRGRFPLLGAPRIAGARLSPSDGSSANDHGQNVAPRTSLRSWSPSFHLQEAAR